MKGKLIKNKDGVYILLHEPSGWGIGSTDHEHVANHRGEQIVSKLSKQNCEEEFAKAMGIVDVEELAFKHSNDLGGRCGNRAYKSFKEGFNTHAELNKDKVFTLEDMRYFAGFAIGYTKHGIEKDTEQVLEDKLKSIQQPTEIEVEIEMEEISSTYLVTIGEVKTTKLEPKLDSEGCLILKKR